MNIAKLILLPLAGLYNLLMRLRNHLYNVGYWPTIQFDTVLIAVGNLNVGGSGKTPMVEYLIRLLQDRYSVATLSRGYKRSTRGYRLAKELETARTIGDEPFQLFTKFGSRVKIAVGEDRVLAIPHMLQDFPDTRTIVLDDAFQQRSIKPQLTILLTEYKHPFYEDFLLPLGRLREARSGARRADIIVVTKCSERLTHQEQQEIAYKIERYAGAKPVFFSKINYETPCAFGGDQSFSKNVIIVSGIAKADYLRQYCLSNFKVLKYFEFPDHHLYSAGDLAGIEQFSRSQLAPFSIVTTEKDMVKLIVPELMPIIARLPWFFIPIRHSFLQDGPKFDELVFGAVDRPTVN